MLDLLAVPDPGGAVTPPGSAVFAVLFIALGTLAFLLLAGWVLVACQQSRASRRKPEEPPA